MGLPTAVRAHREGNLKLARQHYQRALDQENYKEYLFQNYGALLRELGEIERADEIYRLGLKIYPNDRSISLNYANLLDLTNQSKSVSLRIDLLKFAILDSNYVLSDADFVPLVNSIEKSGAINWAYSLCLSALHLLEKPGVSFLICFFRIASHPKNQCLNKLQESKIIDAVESQLSSISELEQAEFYFTLAFVYIKRFRSADAYSSLEKARSILSSADLSSPEAVKQANVLNNTHSWNVACMLLAQGDFSNGWSLFEYGLRTSAKGAQRWQRALPKPFSGKDLQLWRGQSLIGKSLLLLEEQAIGDVMQFMTLLPKLLSESTQLGVLLSDRLLPIYQRSFSDEIESSKLVLWSFSDVTSGKLVHSMYDYQSPIGSICQYRFTKLDDYGTYLPILQSSISESKSFRRCYLKGSTENTKLIGISWRGGGRGDRIKEKSLSVDDFVSILSGFEDFRFVSLQYAENGSTVDEFRSKGLNVIYDKSVNPLKDMDRWLSQVQACDAVVSVANTTIHGSGGLNIPTMCLLSKHSDWRWLKNPDCLSSYWYPSVHIARENSKSGWKDAFNSVRTWINSLNQP